MRYVRLWKNLQNWFLYLKVKFGFDKSPVLRFQTRKGLRIDVPRRLLSPFKEVFMSEAYVTGFGDGTMKARTVADVGANVGFFSFFAASRFPDAQVLCYEPHPNNFAHLKHNLELNPRSGVRIFNKAVGAKKGSLTLTYNPSDEYSTNATLLLDTHSLGATMDVPCEGLEDILAKFEGGRCDLLKLDCEGAEFEILYQAPKEVLERVSRMAVEVHEGKGPGQNAASLKRYLEQNGFKTRAQGQSMLWAWQ